MLIVLRRLCIRNTVVGRSVLDEVVRKGYVIKCHSSLAQDVLRTCSVCGKNLVVNDRTCKSCLSSLSIRNDPYKKIDVNRTVEQDKHKRVFKRKEEKVFLKDALQICEKSGDFTNVIELAEKRMSSGIVKSSVLTTIIQAYGKAGQLEKAVGILDRIKNELRMQPDIRHYAAALRCCVSFGAWKTAMQLVDVLRTSGIKPNCRIYTSLVAVCTTADQLTVAESVIRQVQLESTIEGSLVHLDTAFYNAAIAAFGKAGKTREAFELFERLRLEEAMKADVVTYGAMLSACAKTGDGELAIDVLRRLRSERYVKPNVLVYTAAMMACSKAGQADASLEIFDEMKLKRGLRLDAGCYIAALSACGMSDCKGERALALLAEARDRGIDVGFLGFRAAVRAVEGCADALEAESRARELLEHAVVSGILPAISSSAKRLDLRRVRADSLLCRAAVRQAFSSLAATGQELAGDVLLVLGRVHTEAKDQELQATLIGFIESELRPAGLLKAVASSDGTMLVVKRQSLQAWIAAIGVIKSSTSNR